MLGLQNNNNFSSNRVGIRTCSDYSPFGVELDGRTVSGGYRYGFQNQEKDDEIAGKGNHNSAEFWQYDARVGKRWNREPIVKHHESAYTCYANNPIWFRDVDGGDTTLYIKINATSAKDSFVYDPKTNEVSINYDGSSFPEHEFETQIHSKEKKVGSSDKTSTINKKNQKTTLTQSSYVDAVKSDKFRDRGHKQKVTKKEKM